jgi:alkylation response protein AidB-like acyl-CoA dehydrogenase
MDFNDAPEETAWRAECRDWLAANAPAVASTGPREVMFEAGGGEYLERAKRWQATKFDAGFARITWEPEFGGRNGSTMQQIIFGQEEAHYNVPTDVFVIGLGMIAPTLRACGTDAQQRRYLTKLLRGEEIWCQLFSEPGAGSDVAATSGSSTGRRCGRRARSSPTSARSSAAPTPKPRSTRASPRSSSTCARRASRSSPSSR